MYGRKEKCLWSVQGYMREDFSPLSQGTFTSPMKRTTLQKPRKPGYCSLLFSISMVQNRTYHRTNFYHQWFICQELVFVSKQKRNKYSHTLALQDLVGWDPGILWTSSQNDESKVFVAYTRGSMNNFSIFLCYV